MVVLVIAGITFAAAVPAFNGMIARNRIATQTNDMLLAINLARSEALRTGGIVSVKASPDSPSSTNEFGEGYCVLEATAADDCNCTAGDGDTDAGGDPCPDPIRVFGALVGDTTLDSIDDVTIMQFNSLGGLSGTTNTTRRLDLCHAEQDGRRIVIQLVGRSKSHKPDDPVTANQPDC